MKGKKSGKLGKLRVKSTPFGEPLLLDLETGQSSRDYSRRPLAWSGAMVNPAMEPIEAPWIDADGCTVCGERIRDTALGVSWEDGTDRLRIGGDSYRTRGPVLWAMHVVKADRFTERHLDCGQAYATVESEGLPARVAYAWWADDGPGYAAAVCDGSSSLLVTWITFAEVDPFELAELLDACPAPRARPEEILPF